MSDTIPSMSNEGNTKEVLSTEDTHTALVSDLEALLIDSQPRLAHLASRYGVPPDAVGDIVQETLVAAWQNLDHLRTPDHFESWLNGICRNMSMRWARAQSATDRHLRTFSSLQPEQESPDESVPFDMADPQSPDLAEELNRQDLALLLDRAMDHLPANVRKALEMHYLADLPQREVALQLGMTINALEVKLHRARRQLRQVLKDELRADAESFGLPLDDEPADQSQGWRSTSIWCCICGRQRLQGVFEPQPMGDIGLRLRCPICSLATGTDLVNTAAAVPLAGVRSFRPALKRVLQKVPSFYFGAVTSGFQPCPVCSQPMPLLGVETEVLPAPFHTRLGIAFMCSHCGRSSSSLFPLCLTYTPVYQFVMQHEHYVLEPEKLIDYQEQPAISVSIRDPLSSAYLTLMFHHDTLQLLAAFQN